VVTIASVPTGNAPDGSLLPTDSTDPSGVIQALLALKPCLRQTWRKEHRRARG